MHSNEIEQHSQWQFNYDQYIRFFNWHILHLKKISTLSPSRKSHHNVMTWKLHKSELFRAHNIFLFKRYFIFRTNFAALFTKPTSVSVHINLHEMAPWCHTIKNATPLSEVPEIQSSNEINRSDEWLNTDEERPDEIRHVGNAAYITMRAAPSHYSMRTSCFGYECIVDIMEILHTLQKWPLNIINNSCVVTSPRNHLHPAPNSYHILSFLCETQTETFGWMSELLFVIQWTWRKKALQKQVIR